MPTKNNRFGNASRGPRLNAGRPGNRGRREIVFGPQPGPQTMFLASPADVVIYGGAAGGGKSFGTLLECARHLDVPGFGAICFRRTRPQITNEGSLWDSSKKIFPKLGGTPNQTELKWTFPPHGTAVKFTSIEHEGDVYDYDGAQIPLICFDQLESFTKFQFTYMFSRNRSVCGVNPYTRATCNPMPGSWLLGLIGWWIDDKGDAIRERSGIIKWFVTVSEAFVLADTREELEKRFPGLIPNSLTFIHADLDDNKILTDADPGYRAKLLGLPEHERKRLFGNWKARREGKMFKYAWIKRCDPDKVPPLVRCGTALDPSGGDSDSNDAQGLATIGMSAKGDFYVLSARALKMKPLGWAQAAVDDWDMFNAGHIVGEQNYGGDMVETTVKTVKADVPYMKVTASRGKAVRAEPWASLYENGKVYHVGYFEEYESEMVGFDPTDDKQKSPNILDAAVWGHKYCAGDGKDGILNYWRRKSEDAKKEEEARRRGVTSHKGPARPLALPGNGRK